MKTERTFRFVDRELNQKLRAALRNAKLDFNIERDGTNRYSSGAAETIENEIICSVRDQVFPKWQILTCPPAWIATYRRYMADHEIPFFEELSDGELWFLLPRRFRPHQWKLINPETRGRIAV